MTNALNRVQNKYQNACTSVGLAPNSYILKELKNSKLHIRIEKIQPEEWKPILKCLENDSYMIEIIIELSNVVSQTNIRSKKIKRHYESVFNAAMKTCLFKTLASCLLCSSSIIKLSIINIIMKKSHIKLLSKGLLGNQSLTALCLRGSLNGHKALNEIFPTVKKCCSISHFDFSSCKLNSESCSLIGCLLRSQILERHTETWKQSLRYNAPDVNGVTGFRRMTLNGNAIGDEGCDTISLALQDDYWVRAIDLQQCNISDEGAKKFLILLEENNSLCTLDLRLNENIKDNTILKKIQANLNKNAQTADYEKNFICGEIFTTDPVTPRRKSSSVKNSVSKLNIKNSLNESKVRSRHSQYEKYYNNIKQSIVQNQESLNDIEFLDEKSKFSPILIHSPVKKHTKPPSSTIPSSTHTQAQDQIFQMLDELRRDLQVYKEDLYTEKQKTKLLESKISELERENLYLRQKQEEGDSNLEPELLDTIETSFNQFHSFLDLLKQAGYGDLCQLINKEPS